MARRPVCWQHSSLAAKSAIPWPPRSTMAEGGGEAAGGGGFVPPGDEARLEKAVLELCADPERGRQMGRSGREYVMRHFNRDEQAKEFSALLERLVGLWRGRAPRLNRTGVVF